MNMHYCRFENTLSDLNDCEGALDAFINYGDNDIFSENERQKAKELIELCRYIADNYEVSDIDRQAEYFNQEEDEEANDRECQEE